MASNGKKWNKKIVFLTGVIGTFIILLFILSSGPMIDGKIPTTGDLRISYKLVSSQKMSGGCGALSHAEEDSLLTGACCGRMSEERYLKQRKKIYEYFSNVDEIPKDPWNVPVETAKRFTKYDKEVVLSPNEQAVYNKAMELFDEGPCCCHCWRWTTFNGLAKYLIREKGFNAEQIARLWASEDVCGDEDPFEELEDVGAKDNIEIGKN